jgi:hypothetical protein
MNAAFLSLALFAAPLLQTPGTAPEASENSQVEADDPVAQEAEVEAVTRIDSTQASAPPMTQPADESAPSQPLNNPEMTRAPMIGIGGETVPVHGPRLGLTVRGASVGPSGTYVHADAQSWGALVHNDPELAEMNRLSRLREPGIVSRGSC